MEKHEQLQRQYGDLETRLKSLTNDLISPRRMAQVLHQLLEQDSGVSLIGFKNLPVTKLEKAQKKNILLSESNTTLYKHGFTMTMHGDYASTVQYLQRLEKLNWSIYWDSIHYEVIDYPLAKITLTIYTLSMQKEWISV